MYEKATGEQPPRKKIKTGIESVVDAASQNVLKDMNVKLSSFSAKNAKMEAKLKSNEELIKNLTNHTADIYKQHDRQVEESKQMKLSLKKSWRRLKNYRPQMGHWQKIISDNNIETGNKNERITELETSLAELGGELEGLTEVHATCKVKLQERTENLLGKIYKKDKEVEEMQEKLYSNNTILNEQVKHLT